MVPIRIVTEVMEAIDLVKADAPAFCTNFFPVYPKIQSWIDRQELLVQVSKGAVCFLRRDRDFWHFYFCAASPDVLQGAIEAVSALRTDRVSADLLGHGAAADDLIVRFERAGFRRYRWLIRMTRMRPEVSGPAPVADPRIGLADHADADAILELLTRSFDRYAEQLPMPYEIETAVESGQCLVARWDGAVAGLLFFETQGYTSTVRYWLVDQPFRAQRFGAALMHQYFALHPLVRRFVLWVMADNENAIGKYRHYGYAADGLVDHVVVNGMIYS
jgi:hypothetical protein